MVRLHLGIWAKIDVFFLNTFHQISVSETESMWPCTCMSMWAVNMFCVCEICGKIQIGAIDVAQYNIAFTFVRLTFYKSIHKPNAKNTQMNNTDENFGCVFPVWYGLDYGLPQVPVWLLPISQFHERLFLNNADFKWRMVFSGFYFGCYASRRSFLLLFSFVAFVCFVFRLSYSHGTLVNGICFQHKRRTTCVVLKKKIMWLLYYEIVVMFVAFLYDVKPQTWICNRYYFSTCISFHSRAIGNWQQQIHVLHDFYFFWLLIFFLNSEHTCWSIMCGTDFFFPISVCVQTILLCMH